MLDLGTLKNGLNRTLRYQKQYGWKRTLVKALQTWDDQQASHGDPIPAQHYFLPQILPLRPERTSFEGIRLNLLVPSIQIEHVFGGISTALSLYEKLADHFSHCRIIVTDAAPCNYDRDRFEGYEIDPKSELANKAIVPMHDRYGKTVPVAKGDIFIATAWWTAHILDELLTWQKNVYQIKDSVFLYLIQDYEPGFYPWSTAYAMAESTYRSQHKTIAVFNTKLLSDYFQQLNYRFFYSTFFEPALNQQLQLASVDAQTTLRKEPYQLLIYGRPSTERNCFEMIIHSLVRWYECYPQARYWSLLSAGEKHPDIQIGEGCTLRSLGKLSLEEYARVMAESSVGLSLMLSPHPSYPPIEMAMFGLEVITNRYNLKDLAEYAANITTVPVMTPQNIACALENACQRAVSSKGQPINVSMRWQTDRTLDDAAADIMRLLG